MSTDAKPVVWVHGCGGNAGILMSRCLEQTAVEVCGWDDNLWPRKLAECELTTASETADLIVPMADSLVALWAACPRTFLPSASEVALCQDKSRLAKVLGDIAPLTYWVRDTHGAGGAGAKQVMAAEYLPGRNLSMELLYNRGELLATFQKERLSYSTIRPEPNVCGVGTSMVSRCVDDPASKEVCHWAMKRISAEPHGVYAIDLRENEFGDPKITEINAGRFLTASYVYFYRTGYNLPRMMAEVALGLPVTPLSSYPLGVSIVRGYDREPWVGMLHRYDHEQLETEEEPCQIPAR